MAGIRPTAAAYGTGCGGGVPVGGRRRGVAKQSLLVEGIAGDGLGGDPSRRGWAGRAAADGMDMLRAVSAAIRGARAGRADADADAPRALQTCLVAGNGLGARRSLAQREVEGGTSRSLWKAASLWE